jgi:hypothetical protein
MLMIGNSPPSNSITLDTRSKTGLLPDIENQNLTTVTGHRFGSLSFTPDNLQRAQSAINICHRQYETDRQNADGNSPRSTCQPQYLQDTGDDVRKDQPASSSSEQCNPESVDVKVRDPDQPSKKSGASWSETLKAIAAEMARQGAATVGASAVSSGVQGLSKYALDSSPQAVKWLTGSVTGVANGIAGARVGVGLASFFAPGSGTAKWIGGCIGGGIGVATATIPVFTAVDHMVGAKKGIALLGTTVYSIARDTIQGNLKGLTPQISPPPLLVRDESDHLRFDRDNLGGHALRLGINTLSYTGSSELTNALGVNGTIFGSSLDKEWPEFFADHAMVGLLRTSNEAFDGGIGQLTAKLVFPDSVTYMGSRWRGQEPNTGKADSNQRILNDTAMRISLNQFTTTTQNELGAETSLGTKTARFVSQVINGLTELRGGLLVAMTHTGLNPGEATLKVSAESNLV